MTSPHCTTIDHYIALFPGEVGERLESIRQIIRKEAPEAEEAIKYDIPTFVLKGNMLSFAAFKSHISLFPLSEKMEEAVEGASSYKMGQATARFPLDQPLPVPIITEMVRFRVKERREQ